MSHNSILLTAIAYGRVTQRPNVDPRSYSNHDIVVLRKLFLLLWLIHFRRQGESDRCGSYKKFRTVPPASARGGGTILRVVKHCVQSVDGRDVVALADSCRNVLRSVLP